jgi:hypothetical protein
MIPEVSDAEMVLRDTVNSTGASEISVKTAVLKNLLGELDGMRNSEAVIVVAEEPVTTSGDTVTKSETTSEPPPPPVTPAPAPSEPAKPVLPTLTPTGVAPAAVTTPSLNVPPANPPVK